MPIMYISGELFNAHKLTYEQGIKNWENVVEIAHKITQKGWTAEIPHNSIFMWKYLKDKFGIDLPHEYWMQQDSGKIKVCQALYFVSHSRGADMELQYALDNDMKIYTSIDQVPTVPVEDCLLKIPITTKPYTIDKVEGNQDNN